MQTKAGAVAHEHQLLIELQQEHGTEKTARSAVGPILFAKFIEQYLANYVAVHMRPSSRRSTLSKLRTHIVPFFGQKLLAEIAPAEIGAFTAQQVALGLAPKTINNHLSMLHAALVVAQDWNLLREVPRIRWVRVPTPAFRYLSRDEVERLLGAASAEFWRPLLAFLAYTGVRFGEAAALRWEDIEIERPDPIVHIVRGVAEGVVGPTKTGRHRHIPLVPALVRELQRYWHARPYVFTRPADGKFLSPYSTRKHLHRICDDAGVKRISWHVLRHTFATELTAQGAPLPAVQQLLGHTTIQMTARYAHVAPSTLRASVMLLERPVSEPASSDAVWSPNGHQGIMGKEWSPESARCVLDSSASQTKKPDLSVRPYSWSG